MASSMLPWQSKQNWDLCKLINRHIKLITLPYIYIFLYRSSTYFRREKRIVILVILQIYGKFQTILDRFQPTLYARQIVFALKIVHVKKCSVQRLPKVKLKRAKANNIQYFSMYSIYTNL